MTLADAISAYLNASDKMHAAINEIGSSDTISLAIKAEADNKSIATTCDTLRRQLSALEEAYATLARRYEAEAAWRQRLHAKLTRIVEVGRLFILPRSLFDAVADARQELTRNEVIL